MKSTHSIHLDELNWQEFKTLVPNKIDLAFLPVGTIEAHGCTNLGTDITIPVALCEKLAKKFNGLVAPPINYGITRTLLAHPGSITVSPESFESYTCDVMIGLFDTGFRRLVVINGHGGHSPQLENSAKKAWHKTRGKTVIIHWWMLADNAMRKVLGTPGGHAAINETAMIMAIKPDLVKPDLCNGVKTFLVREKSTYVYPAPATVLFYEGYEGKIIPTKMQAKKCFEVVIDEISRFLKEVFGGWKEI